MLSRNTAFSFENPRADPRQISDDLGVRYVLTGNIRRIGDTMRINATLVDGGSGGQLWAARFDGSTADILGFQDEVIAQVVDALPLHLELAQVKEAELGNTDNPGAFDAYLKGTDQYRLRTPEGHGNAAVYLEQAVALDPDYGRAYALLAAVYFEAWNNHWNTPFGIPYINTRSLKQKSTAALEAAMAHPTPLAHLVAAQHRRVDGQLSEMMGEARAALRLDDNDPDAYCALSQAMLLQGTKEGALGTIEHAMSLD